MVIVFLAEGFEEIEALTPVDILRRAGAEVLTVAVGRSREVKGSHGIPVTADTTVGKLEDDVKPEMIILPGGMPGTTNLKNNKKVIKMIKDAVDSDAWVAAICAAPSILGGLGLLSGRSAICYPGFEKFLTGARLSDAKVAVDGRFVTAKGMGVSLAFSLVLTALLFGQDKADELAASVQTDVR